MIIYLWRCGGVWDSLTTLFNTVLESQRRIPEEPRGDVKILIGSDQNGNYK